MKLRIILFLFLSGCFCSLTAQKHPDYDNLRAVYSAWSETNIDVDYPLAYMDVVLTDTLLNPCDIQTIGGRDRIRCEGNRIVSLYFRINSDTCRIPDEIWKFDSIKYIEVRSADNLFMSAGSSFQNSGVKKLVLSGNWKVEILDVDSFRNNSISELFLENVENFAPASFRLPNLRKLSMSPDTLSLPIDFFENKKLTFLEILKWADNTVPLDERWGSLTSLDTLTLHLWRPKDLEVDFFGSLKSLEKADLEWNGHNYLKYPESLFQSKNIKDIHLGINFRGQLPDVNQLESIEKIAIYNLDADRCIPRTWRQLCHDVVEVILYPDWHFEDFEAFCTDGIGECLTSNIDETVSSDVSLINVGSGRYRLETLLDKSWKVMVHDTNGKLISFSTLRPYEEMDLGHLSSGLYLATYMQGTRSYTDKIWVGE